MALVALGGHREARRWYRTAQLATDETGDRATRAWLLAREAVIPFYFGSPLAAAQLTERARMVAGNTPCATAAWAPLWKPDPSRDWAGAMTPSLLCGSPKPPSPGFPPTKSPTQATVTRHGNCGSTSSRSLSSTVAATGAHVTRWCS